MVCTLSKMQAFSRIRCSLLPAEGELLEEQERLAWATRFARIVRSLRRENRQVHAPAIFKI
jgi:hypothetical protein